MSIPSRVERARTLAKTFDAVVSVDTGKGRPSALRGHRAALREALTRAAGHVFVLQDDAVPHPSLRSILPRVVAARPGHLVSLYFGSARADRSAYLRTSRSCAHWYPLPTEHFVPTVGLVWPVEAAADFLAWSAGYANAGLPFDDEAIKDWRKQSLWPAVATIPSLVGHDNGLRSTLGHEHHGARTALCADGGGWLGAAVEAIEW